MSWTDLFSKEEDDSKILASVTLSDISDKAQEFAYENRLSYVLLRENKIIKVSYNGKIIRTIGEIKKHKRLKTGMSLDII